MKPILTRLFHNFEREGLLPSFVKGAIVYSSRRECYIQSCQLSGPRSKKSACFCESLVGSPEWLHEKHRPRSRIDDKPISVNTFRRQGRKVVHVQSYPSPEIVESYVVYPCCKGKRRCCDLHIGISFDSDGCHNAKSTSATPSPRRDLRFERSPL
jgi:hypothetical protein